MNFAIAVFVGLASTVSAQELDQTDSYTEDSAALADILALFTASEDHFACGKCEFAEMGKSCNEVIADGRSCRQYVGRCECRAPLPRRFQKGNWKDRFVCSWGIINETDCFPGAH